MGKAVLKDIQPDLTASVFVHCNESQMPGGHEHGSLGFSVEVKLDRTVTQKSHFCSDFKSHPQDLGLQQVH